MRRLLSSLLLLLAQDAASQVYDDFSDFNLSRNPEWVGDSAHWQTGYLRGSAALQSLGESRSDTISLALPTGAAYGRWEFVFAHRDVNLSTFNGARIFLVSDRADAANARGYYLQIGTNNSDVVSLWRLDGSMSASRVELGRSSGSLAAGDSSYLEISVRRLDGSWHVWVNGEPVIDLADDGVYPGSYYDGSYFVVWVKHSAAGARSFLLDDLLVEGTSVEPPPPPLPELPIPEPGEIIINEIQHDPPSGSSEFIEFLNTGSDTFDLSRVTLRDSQSGAEPISKIPLPFPPGAYVVAVQNGSAFQSAFPGVAFVQPAKWPSLNNSGDRVRIDVDGAAIDSVKYEGSWSSDHRSLERIDPGGPGDRYNFGPSEAAAGASPGMMNSIYRPDVTGPRLVFVEQIESRTLALIFDEPLGPLEAGSLRNGSQRPTQIVQEDEFVFHASFSLPPDAADVEIGSVADRKGNVSRSVRQAIAFLPQEKELVINEIMYEPLADEHDGQPDQAEYLEILNRSSRLLSLGGLLKTRRPNESGDADTVSVAAPLTSIEPNSFYVVHSGPLEVAFDPMEPGTSSRLFSNLGLRNSGDRIALHGRDGAVIEVVGYDADLHHFDVADTRGLSLERIDSDGPGGDPSNWTTSVDPRGGTPGRVNSVRVNTELPTAGLAVSPSPFSPDRDGHDDVASIGFHLRSGLSTVRIRIFDTGGRRVRELIRSTISAGEGTAYWDGLDDHGRMLPVGVYIVYLEASAEQGGEVEAYKVPVVLAKRL